MQNSSEQEIVQAFSQVIIRLHTKTNFSLKNNSSIMLATDILRDSIKLKLFKVATFTIVQAFSNVVDGFPLKSKKDNKALFLYLVETTLKQFLLSSYGQDIQLKSNLVKNSFYTQCLLEDEKTLVAIPISLLNKNEPELFTSIFGPVYREPSNKFFDILLDNLLIEVTNAVMVIILNEFSYIYDIRKKFYRSNFLSIRNIERFRNNLSWQQKLRYFLNRPNELYNNQYGLWIIRTTGIYYRVIYANRTVELQNLQYFSLVTLILIETKDFLMSRFDEVVYFFSSGVRYTLTTFIGQFIGLTWRGIIEGLKK
jgi:hypothetical protein